MRKIRAGVAFTDNQNSFEGGKRAAAEALKKIGQECSLVISFCTAKHDYQAFFDGLRAEVGDVPVIGGPAIGVITNECLGYGGYQAGVAVLPGDLIFDVESVGGLGRGEKEGGFQLGRQI